MLLAGKSDSFEFEIREVGFDENNLRSLRITIILKINYL